MLNYDDKDHKSEADNEYNEEPIEQKQHEAIHDEPEHTTMDYTKMDDVIKQTEHRNLSNSDEQIDETEQVHSEINTNEDVPPSKKVDHPSPKKQKKNWGQTIMSGVIGSVLTFGLITYTPLFNGDVENDPSTYEEGFTLNQTEEGDEAVPTISTVTDGSSLADMVEEASKAIVGIVNYQKGSNPFSQFSDDIVEGGSGSGVVIKEEGEYAYVVTNNHVIENAEKIEVSLANGETVEAKLIGADALSDLAVLRISNEHVEKVLKFGDSSAVRAGEQVVAIGNPLGLEFSRTVTQGIISAVDRTIKTRTSAGEWDLHVIQTDAAINPGNSGGPLVNMDGEVIGINSLKIATSNVEGMGFAIPSNDVVPLVEEMVQKGAVARPYIGISMVDVTQIPRSYLGDLPDDVQEGVAVTDVDANSPAGRGGIQPGDIIVGMNGETVNSINELRSVLYKDLKVGDEVTFDIYRGKDQMKLDVTLTSNTME